MRNEDFNVILFIIVFLLLVGSWYDTIQTRKI